METVSWSRAPMIATPVYLALVLVGLLFILLGDDALSGVFAVILTLPWSAAVTGLMDSAMEVDGAVSGSVGVVVGAAINAAIIYGVMRFVTRRRGARRA
ncbi:hypothetical protein GCM10025788_10920 [Serinicoccus chungangensis]